MPDCQQAGYGGGWVTAVAAVMMVLGGERSGITSATRQCDLEMNDECRIVRTGMRDVFWSGRNLRLGMVMAVGQNYEVSKQAALTAWRCRKWGRRGGPAQIAGTSVDDYQAAAFTDRACRGRWARRIVRWQLHLFSGLRRQSRSTEQTPALVESLMTITVCQETVVADADETVGERVHQEAADELGAGQVHDLGLLALRVILVPKAYLPVAQLDQPLVRDGHAMGVTSQVLEHPMRAAKRSLGVDDPVLLYRCIELALHRRLVRAKDASLPWK